LQRFWMVVAVSLAAFGSGTAGCEAKLSSVTGRAVTDCNDEYPNG
jgi:hypothetical protein